MTYKRKSTGTGGSSGNKGKKKDVAPKGTIKTFGGKKYKSLGGGNWQGYSSKKPNYKKPKRKIKTNYKSTRSKAGKPRKRKY